MALKFISHREIAFRQLLGMLRTPPQAMMNYYSNVFLSARFVLSDQPDKLRFLDKEIRRVECLVGVFPTEDSTFVQDKLYQLFSERQSLMMDMTRLESMYDAATKEEQKEIEEAHKEITAKVKQINAKEHYLLYKLQPIMSLKMMETYMDNNMDLKSYFKENMQAVTQLELASELDKVKIWVYQEAVQLMPYVRFTKLE
jgi:hypothetical protein